MKWKFTVTFYMKLGFCNSSPVYLLFTTIRYCFYEFVSFACCFFLSLLFVPTSVTYFYLFIVDEYAYLIAEFGIYRILMHIMLTLAEMVIFKIVYMFKFSIIAALDEYFFTNFVTLCNVAINFVFSIIRITLGENKRTKMYFRSFAKPTDVYERIPWP